jgi:hypothetical protein
VQFGPKKVEISGPTPSNAREMDLPPSKSIRPALYKNTGTLVILWTRDKREARDFRAHSEMVYNKMVISLRGRIKGVTYLGYFAWNSLHMPTGPAQRMSVMSSSFLLHSVLLLIRHLGGYGLVTSGLLDCLSETAIFPSQFSIHFTFSSNLNFLLKQFVFFSL